MYVRITCLIANIRLEDLSLVLTKGDSVDILSTLANMSSDLLLAVNQKAVSRIDLKGQPHSPFYKTPTRHLPSDPFGGLEELLSNALRSLKSFETSRADLRGTEALIRSHLDGLEGRLMSNLPLLVENAVQKVLLQNASLLTQTQDPTYTGQRQNAPHMAGPLSKEPKEEATPLFEFGEDEIPTFIPSHLGGDGYQGTLKRAESHESDSDGLDASLEALKVLNNKSNSGD